MGPEEQLTARERQILELLLALAGKGETTPCYRDIALAIGVSSTNTVDYNLKKLERKGLVTLGNGKARSVRLVRKNVEPQLSLEVLRIPVVGKIVAGSPIPLPDAGNSAYEAEGETFSLPWSALPSGDFGRLYALRVKGDSMVDAGILDGDTVVMKRIDDPATEIKNGDMVAAWIKDKQMTTLKRVYFSRKEVELRPENPRYQTIPVKLKDIEIHGKVIYVARQVNRWG
ncbi:MAG: transcriptional repressor LexA [Anaerolineae bacterium]